MAQVSLPSIIQGGMGVGVSGWQLAGAVAREGQLGVVSGTALEFVYARRLQDGDPDGHVRRAFSHFPYPAMAERILERYFAPGGRPADERYRGVPMYTLSPPAELIELSIVANFAEVWLARERGQGGPVGINFLYKIQLPLLASIYGAMLAGVDAIIVGAGIPSQLPALIGKLARGEDASLEVKVDYASEPHHFTLRPSIALGRTPPRLPRPYFLAIISSVEVGRVLLSSDEVPDGFVVEGSRAGGHNAPPRGPRRLDDEGQPVYGPLDDVALAEIDGLGKPFWLAGSYGDPDSLALALAAGAMGIQVGTAFAFCEESGVAPDLKAAVMEAVASGAARVLTDPVASPTGFPFKVIQVSGTLSEPAEYAARRRVCDVGALRTPFKSRQGGNLGYRCPAEPEGAFSRKGGFRPATLGRKCLCNALLANIGLGQRRASGDEQALLTAGDDLASVARFVPAGATSYRAADVIAGLLAVTSLEKRAV